MAEKLKAETRTVFGKGAARKIRALDKIPAVIYGHGTETQHVTLPGHETALILRKANALLELDIDGATQTVLVKDVQRDPVRQIIEHLDLVIVRRGEKVQVDVPVRLEGESFAGTIANLDATSLLLEVEAVSIPEAIVVDIEGLEEGTQVLASDVKLPEGAELVTEPETLVVGIIVPQLDLTTDAEEDTAEGEGDVVPEEGDGDAEAKAEDSE